MAPPRRRTNLLRRRRRDAEDDDGATERADDSQSEASFLSDEDQDADASDLSDGESVATRNGRNKASSNPSAAPAAPPAPTASFAPASDTDAMMNGMKASHDAAQAVDFDKLGDDAQDNAQHEPAPITAAAGVTQAPPTGQQSTAASSTSRLETPAERRRREHEEYKKKRDEDPAFIPNRGAFFMHDHRSPGAGPNGFKPYGRGRGRGRGAVGGPFSPASLMARDDAATSAPWTHDLHETLEESQPQPAGAPPTYESHHLSSDLTQPPKPSSQNASTTPPVRSFSSTKLVGNARIRVSIAGMKAPIYFSEVPIREYTKLPNHRPPLRRDKPVRISLPEQPPRYIFPATERSFIFIPRALRPNQQGFGRGRGRFGSYGGFSSRRTSAYGGSVYTPSVLSRRSSLARDYRADGLVSPAGSMMSRPPGAPMDPNRPVVRLPPGAQSIPSGPPSQAASVHGGATPAFNMPPQQGYPLPQGPAYRERWGALIPMHQPKPQKQVSMAGIESPANLAVHAPQQQEQVPFHQQVPLNPNGAPPPPSYPAHVSTGTPLSNIPERAIHAQPFQPYQQAGYAPQGFAAPAYYYPPAPTGQYPPGSVVPMYMPNPQQGGYQAPAPVPASVPAPAPAGPPAQGGMVAHEQNGMVYYYDPGQIAYAAPVEGYPPPGNYTVPGMGGMMTPSPDGYYYPQVPPGGMVYYATQ
ncbi:CASC3/Barentsz eIF4AIII binding-domain-containing protein [Phyllosticta citrichinensis]